MAGYPSDKADPSSARGRADDLRAWVRRPDGVEAVARYLADMTGQLESMARAADLELLAYLLAMARSEAEAMSRKPPHAADDLEP